MDTCEKKSSKFSERPSREPPLKCMAAGRNFCYILNVDIL